MRVFPIFLAALLATTAAAQDKPAVTVRPLAEVAIHPERDAAAQAVSLNESRISAEIAGRIEAVPVEVGQRLEKGAVIARIDCLDHELSRDRARAALAAVRSRLALAEQQLGRAKELSAKGFFAEEALAARSTEAAVLHADRAQAEVQLAAAERAIGKCVVRSPFPAIVRERLGRVGELAAPGTPLAALVDAGRIEVAAQVQAKDTPSLERAAEVRFLGPRGALPVALERVSPAIDPQTRAVDARLRFTGAAAAAGASGRIVWRDGDAHLPPELVVRRAGRLGVFVDDAGTARFHALAEAQEGRPARVDLPAGARLVVKGQVALKDGQRLR
jgi:RND family efflux transporter MFP subunit